MLQGQRWRTLFLVKEVRFSITQTRAPSSWDSMAVLSPMGPAPTTTMFTLEACMLPLNTGILALSSTSLNKLTPRHDFTFSWKY